MQAEEVRLERQTLMFGADEVRLNEVDRERYSETDQSFCGICCV